MVCYQIEWKKSAWRDLKRVDRQAVATLIAAVEELSANPLRPGVVKLQGSERTYRIRVGDYRVLYELFHSQLVVLIVRVRHRQDVYKAR